MHSHGVLGLVVDAFDDVDFAVVGPGGPGRPEGGPDAAGTAGHVFEVEDYEAVRVLLCACYADAVATASAGDSRGVGADDYGAVEDIGEVFLLGGAGVDVVDVAVGGVVFGVEGEPVEEIIAAVVI